MSEYVNPGDLLRISVRPYCALRASMAAGGALMVVKPHIDIMLKLHKMLNKDCPAQTNAEWRQNDAEIVIKPHPLRQRVLGDVLIQSDFHFFILI